MNQNQARILIGAILVLILVGGAIYFQDVIVKLVNPPKDTNIIKLSPENAKYDFIIKSDEYEIKIVDKNWLLDNVRGRYRTFEVVKSPITVIVKRRVVLEKTPENSKVIVTEKTKRDDKNGYTVEMQIPWYSLEDGGDFREPQNAGNLQFAILSNLPTPKGVDAVKVSISLAEEGKDFFTIYRK